ADVWEKSLAVFLLMPPPAPCRDQAPVPALFTISHARDATPPARTSAHSKTLTARARTHFPKPVMSSPCTDSLARIGAGIDRRFFGRSRRAERKKTQSPALVTGVEIADEVWLPKSVLTSSWTRSRIAFDGVEIFTAASIGQRIASE